MFIRSIDGNQRKAKLLFVMGATWHNSCFFDIDCHEDSLADLLVDQGIETYTFNNFGTGPEEKTDTIGNLHQQNIDRAVEIIAQYQIDYVLFYSYGCFLAPDILKSVDLKGAMLLDPCPGSAGIIKTPADTGWATIDKLTILDVLKRTTKINRSMISAHLKNLCSGTVSTTAYYPTAESIARKNTFLEKENIDHLYSTAPLKIFFTNTVSEKIQGLFPAETVIKYPDWSHWIIIEDGRYALVEDVVEFINQTLDTKMSK